jgi:hypothetical protein
VCIFVHKEQYLIKINISHNRTEKYLEICSTELETKSSKLIIYGVPTGDYHFVMNLNYALKHLHKPKRNF